MIDPSGQFQLRINFQTLGRAPLAGDHGAHTVQYNTLVWHTD
jgi:hypothetical protein